jgi:transcription elongation factor GreA
MAQTHHLSRTALDRLQAEYDDLTTRGRIEIAQAIERARELGDLSENGDYHAAKDHQGHMEARIRALEAILENAEVVDDAVEGVVSPGSIVTIRYEGDDDDMAETYLVGHIEEKGRHDVISPTSPLGAALIGRRAGDEVEYDAPGGVLKVTIVKAETEAAAG